MENAYLEAIYDHIVNNEIFNTRKLYSNGKVDSENSEHTWEITDKKLILKFKANDAPGGYWVDTCPLTEDLQGFQGSNQINIDIRGIM